MITTLDDFTREFQKIRERGWIKTHRSGPTGIGKTLEDLLGIPENNSGEPDFGDYELKSARLKSNSLLTLFTLSPHPKKSNGQLLQKYGYIRDGERVLRVQIRADRFTRLPSNHDLKLTFEEGKIVYESEMGKEQIYHNKADILEVIKTKFAGEIVLAYAEKRGSKEQEHFWFKEAYRAKVSYGKFLDLLEAGVVRVEPRLGLYPDGRTHDHGTAFRIKQADQESLFVDRQRLV